MNDSPATLEQGAVCPSARQQWNGLRSYDKFAAPNTEAGREAAYHFDAPSGTTVVGASLTRWIGKDTSNSWTPFVRAGSTVHQALVRGSAMLRKARRLRETAAPNGALHRTSGPARLREGAHGEP